MKVGTIIIYRISICIMRSTRALPNVLAMERVLLCPSLVKCLSSLSIRFPQLQMKLWMEQKKAIIRATTLIKALGTLTSAQAKRLNTLGNNSKTSWKYIGRAAPVKHSIVLKERGINSKPLWRSSRKRWGTPARRPLGWLSLALQRLLPCPPASPAAPSSKELFCFLYRFFLEPPNYKSLHGDVAAARVLLYRSSKGGADNW